MRCSAGRNPSREGNEMGNIGFREILVILLIIVILFGARRIPELARSLGKGIDEFKGGMKGEPPQTGRRRSPRIRRHSLSHRPDEERQVGITLLAWWRRLAPPASGGRARRRARRASAPRAGSPIQRTNRERCASPSAVTTGSSIT